MTRHEWIVIANENENWLEKTEGASVHTHSDVRPPCQERMEESRAYVESSTEMIWHR